MRTIDVGAMKRSPPERFWPIEAAAPCVDPIRAKLCFKVSRGGGWKLPRREGSQGRVIVSRPIFVTKARSRPLLHRWQRKRLSQASNPQRSRAWWCPGEAHTARLRKDFLDLLDLLSWVRHGFESHLLDHPLPCRDSLRTRAVMRRGDSDNAIDREPLRVRNHRDDRDARIHNLWWSRFGRRGRKGGR
jgi:hypothetical protein